MRNAIYLLGVMVLSLSGCDLATSQNEQLATAKVEILKAAVDGEEVAGKPVIRTIEPGKGDGTSILGTFCGTLTDDGVAGVNQKPRRFVYMAVDKGVVFETIRSELLTPTSDAERKIVDEAVTTFNSLWNDSCA